MRAGLTQLRGGPGTGKTLLLRLLAGQVPATRGILRIHGVSAADAPDDYLRQVFWTEPGSCAVDALDAVTPTAYLDSISRAYPCFDQRQIAPLVDDFSLQDHMFKPVHMLSTGTKRKVLLTAAFASGATLTLLDEPYAALDKPSANALEARLGDAARQRTRTWLVAHHGQVCDAPLAGVIDLDTWQQAA